MVVLKCHQRKKLCRALRVRALNVLWTQLIVRTKVLKQLMHKRRVAMELEAIVVAAVLVLLVVQALVGRT